MFRVMHCVLSRGEFDYYIEFSAVLFERGSKDLYYHGRKCVCIQEISS